ncbi:MAG: EAL domain-containing protein [Gammaproteobacteria bacterium]|nr:EAL domain-containing protein [Gammaproteobacteria bacterium]
MSEGRLLILDDDPMTGQTMQSIAEFAGMEVRSTTSHEDFFGTVGQWLPDVIALDLIMPGMDGVEVMSELAVRGCDASIIITSGVGSRVLDAAARSAGEHGLNIVGVLPKPFLPAALRDLLSKCVPAEQRSDPVSPAPLQAPRRVNLTEADLDLALERNELFVVYQPKLHCQSGALAGFEALVRWQHPDLGIVPPDRFIGLAERSGRMDALTRTVFTQALDWFTELRRGAGPAGEQVLSTQTLNSLTLSLNVSAVTLGSVDLFDWLEALCESHGLTPDRLILELTETSAMEDPIASLDMMTRLRMKGFQLSIDDFGTGYSSMLQLVRLPFSEIKVDKSFVLTASNSEESRTVIRSVVDLGRSLGLRSTAEGVEDAATLDYLRRIGCDLAQGFHIARPMPGDDVVPWARDHDAARESMRVEALHALNILDTPEEPRFDRLARLTQRLLHVPIALVSLVDAERLWFKSHIGLDIRETPRGSSFSSQTIQIDRPLVITDAHTDPRFKDSALVTEVPGVRFYAGVPLHAPGGSMVGTLCAIDMVPRQLPDDELELLQELARLVEKELWDHKAAITDPLTGVLNRQGFDSRAGDALALSTRLSHHMALLFLDLDDLQAINGQYGYPEGDRALQAFGTMLMETFRESDLIARMGGDEFVVLMLDAGPDDASSARERLDQALDAHNAANPNGYKLSVSVGIAAVGADDEKDLQALLAEADALMYQNKQA